MPPNWGSLLLASQTQQQLSPHDVTHAGETLAFSTVCSRKTKKKPKKKTALLFYLMALPGLKLVSWVGTQKSFKRALDYGGGPNNAPLLPRGSHPDLWVICLYGGTWQR